MQGDYERLVKAHPGLREMFGRSGIGQRAVDHFDQLGGGDALPCPVCGLPPSDHRS